MTLLATAGCAAEVVEMGAGAEADGRFTDLAGTIVPPATDAAASTTPVTPANPSPYGIGTCIVWDQASAAPVFGVVPCDDPHLVEVTDVLLFEEGIDVAFPTVDDLTFITDEYCIDTAASYVGAEALPERLQAGAIPPTEAEWAEGERWFACTVGLLRVDGRRPAYTGRLADGG